MSLSHFIKSGLPLIYFVFMPFCAQAKKNYFPELYNQPKSHLELDVYYGFILKHTNRITTPINESSQAVEISYTRSLFGKKYFEQKFNYPYIGGSLIFAKFGNNEYFGNAIGAIPHITFWIKRSKILDAYFRMGIGLAYLTKPYDYFTNPINNVIGSNINNVTQLRWGVNWKITERSNINTAFNFTHFSNGHSQNPNLGINFLGLSVGYRLNFGVGKHIYQRDTTPKLLKKNYFVIGTGFGFLEKGRAAYGPTFNSYSAFFQYNRATGKTNHLITGLNFEYNDMFYKETMYRENNESNISNRTINSTTVSILLGDEILLHRVGFMMQIGIYVFTPYISENFMFQKIGLNYYFPEFKKTNLSLFVGTNVKIHLTVAESFECRTGVRF